MRTLKSAAERLEDVGTPEGMPEPAREGFALTIRRIQELPADATQEDLERLGDVDEDDQAVLDELEAYVERTCPELSESPSPG